MTEPVDSYEITDPEQLEQIVSMRRHDIGDRLTMSGPMSVSELARAVGAKPSAMYHHIEALLKVGLVVEAGSRVVNRKREQLYATPGRRMRLQAALADPANRDVMNRMVAAMTRQIGRDFAAGADLPTKELTGDARNYRFFRMIGRPSAEERARINACLAEITEILWQSGDNDAPLVAVDWVMTPLAEPHAGKEPRPGKEPGPGEG